MEYLQKKCQKKMEKDNEMKSDQVKSPKVIGIICPKQPKLVKWNQIMKKEIANFVIKV